MSQAFHGGRLDEAQRRFGRAVELDFSVNCNALWTPPALPGCVALAEALTRYPDADGARAAQRLADLHALPPEQIVPTAGAIEGLYLAARLFAGKRAAVFQPAFADYARSCVAADIEVCPLPLPEPAPTTGNIAPADALAERLLTANIDVVFLGHPNNPSGSLFPHLEELVRHPALAHLAWIIDEAFIEFVAHHKERSLLPKLDTLPRVLVLRALTKSWSVPGLRLGLVATSNAAWLERLRTMQPPWSINGVAEAWLLQCATLEQKASMLASLEALPALRQAQSERLAALPGLQPHPSDANFLLVQTNAQTALQLEETLGREGLLIRVCRGFAGLDPERHFRVAIRSEADNRRLADALARALAPTQPPAPIARVASSARAKTTAKHRGMRSISVLGTSSNAGKSWFATALCAWLRRRGLRVAPFKAQNMSNNSAVALDGGEIGRAQAAQAEACGLPPSVRMNPILLKPSGKSGSQLVRLGKAEGHIPAAEYYRRVESLWPTVTESLAYWQERCDVLVLEGAGSPVELNLLNRDLVNLRPVRHLDGRWLLVADIERGGVFAQAAGTWALLNAEDRRRCCGLVVNKFRGDLSLFAGAARHFAPHFGAPLLGTLPYANELQPENEDSLSDEPAARTGGDPLHWIRFPHLSNGQDTNPWQLDEGVHIEWVDRPAALENARLIVLPGSKNTIADLAWLRASGLAEAILRAHQKGAFVVGICGGFQMLGQWLRDPEGLAGDPGEVPGLGLLPVETLFAPEKEVRTVRATYSGESWEAYEIHMGRTQATAPVESLLHVEAPAAGETARSEGFRAPGVWGTYLHGLFEARSVREALAAHAGLQNHRAAAIPFRKQREALYSGMADLVEEHLNLEDLWRYVAD